MTKWFARVALGICLLVVWSICIPAAPARADEEADEEADEPRVLEVGRWYPGMDWNLNVLQSAYSSNWAFDDKSSASWSTQFIGRLENQFHEDWNWFNRLKMAFGQQLQQDDDRNWRRPEKTVDELDFESLLRWERHSPWDPYLSLRIRSQFADRSDEFGRDLFLNPVSFTEATGISRAFINTEKKILLLRLGVSTRQLIRQYFITVDPDDHTTASSQGDDLGLELRVDYRTPILGDAVNWLSRVTLYQPFWYSAEQALADISAADRATYGIGEDVASYSTTIRGDWENQFTVKVTKVIAIQLEVRFIYAKYDNSVVPEFDAGGNLINGEAVSDAVRKEVQFKEVLSLGLVWSI
jgi:hypothetical protein